MFQLIQLNFTESGNPRLCRICYKIVMSLKKAADDLEVKKRELSESEVIDVQRWVILKISISDILSFKLSRYEYIVS